MAWGRCDDQHWRNRKVRSLDGRLGRAALGSYWLAISYCNDHDAHVGPDGHLSVKDLRMLDIPRRDAEELVRVGLWESRDDGYLIHDFLQFNFSKAQIAERHAARAEAGKAGADSRWHGKGHSKSNGTEDAPYPNTRIPTSYEDREDYAALRAVGLRLTAGRKRVLDEIAERHDVAGPRWAADILASVSDDHFGRLLEADQRWRKERLAAAAEEEGRWQAEKAEEKRAALQLEGATA